MESVIISKPSGEEIDYLNESEDIDFDIGHTNDFKIVINTNDWDDIKFGYEHRLFIPGSEYGGIIEDIEHKTASEEVILRGPCWRGMLKRKIIEPPEGSTNLILNGELNEVLKGLIEDRFDGLFFVPEVNSGIKVVNHQVDRYVTLYDAVTKLLQEYGHRLKMKYFEPEGLEYGYVIVRAAPVIDYSEEYEYSQDGKVAFSIREYRGGINHLVCVGKGEGEERIVLDLYVQKDGTIGKIPYYKGLQEREALFEYSSAVEEELEKYGIERLKELMNYKKIEVTVDDVDMDIGDIVGGYDQVTNTYVSKPIVGKIMRMSDGKIDIEYMVKGDD